MSETDSPTDELIGLVRQTGALVQSLVDSGVELLRRKPVIARAPAKPAAARPDDDAKQVAPTAAARAPAAHASATAAAYGAAAIAAVAAAGKEASAAPPAAGNRASPSASEGGGVTRLTADERHLALAQLAEQVRDCTRCCLSESRTHTAFARGSAEAELVFVGEGPGAEEDAQGLPFVGKAGQLLDRMVAAMGYQRDSVYICNIVKCRPPKNRKPEPDEVAACAPYLREQLALLEPRVIVALGATGVQGLLGVHGGITRLRGTWRLYRGRVPLMPTFHPAYLLRRPEKKREVWGDLKQVMDRLSKGPPPRGDGHASAEASGHASAEASGHASAEASGQPESEPPQS